MLRVSGLRKDFGEKVLFAHVSFAVAASEKVGIVGPNGCGKTTLLKILAGLAEADQGSVRLVGSPAVAYLPQHSQEIMQATVGEFLAADLYRSRAAVQDIEAEMQCHPNDADLLAAYSLAVERFESAGGYAFESRLDVVLAGLEMASVELTRPLPALSGGQRTRIALARVLLRDADLLLLDEPTNNLDVAALEWVEDSLRRCRSACLIVSHDRRFLDRVTTRTLELDPIAERISDYAGNYSWYRLRKDQEEARQLREYKEQQDRIHRLTDDIRTVKEQARATENRTVNDYLRGRSKKVAAKAKAREGRLLRLIEAERVEKPRQVARMRFAVEGRNQYTSPLIRLENLSCELNGVTLLHDVNLQVVGSSRTIVSGRNGSGKSTLLRLLVGELAPSTGLIKKKERLRICYLPQNQESIPGEDNVLDFFRSCLVGQRDRCDTAHLLIPYGPRRKASPVHNLWNDSDARTFLHRFQFSRDDVFKSVRQLSCGERTKLLLATFMAASPDMMILDEPTNHLDLPTLECLEKALMPFKGALVIVSHDRCFVEKLAPHWYWHVADGKVASKLRPGL